jgi:hypothetical protein
MRLSLPEIQIVLIGLMAGTVTVRRGHREQLSMPEAEKER